MKDEDNDIPENLDEAIKWLKNNISPEEQHQIAESELEANRGHHVIGRWMRNNWGLWQQDSKLYDYFVNLGIRHADDMTGIILDSFQRDLRNEPRELDKQVKHYREYWKGKNINPDMIGEQND